MMPGLAYLRERGYEPRSEIPLRPNALRRGRESGAEGIGQRGPQDTYKGLRVFLSTGARIEGRCRFYSGLFFRIGASPWAGNSS